jgi:hypothetical protein
LNWSGDSFSELLPNFSRCEVRRISSSRRLASCTSASAASTSARRAFRWAFSRLRSVGIHAEVNHGTRLQASKNRDSRSFRSPRRQRTPRPLRPHQPPIQPLEQRRQLRRRHPHHPVAHLRPDELAALQPLVNQHHPGLVPDQQLDPVRPFRPEDEDRPAERVQPEHLLHRQRQAVDALAEVHRPRRHEDLHRPALAEHHDAAARTARIARVSCPSSASAPARITTSPTTISTRTRPPPAPPPPRRPSTTSSANIGRPPRSRAPPAAPSAASCASRRPASASCRAAARHPPPTPRHQALRRDPRPLRLRAPPPPGRPLDHLQPGNPNAREPSKWTPILPSLPNPNLRRSCARRMARSDHQAAGGDRRRAYLPACECTRMRFSVWVLMWR